MKLLVTGGAGFIGSNFIRYWLRQHPTDFIVNVDALTYAGNLENLSDLKDDARYQFVHGNIIDRNVIFPLVEACDVVVHFAAESHVDRSILEFSGFVATNVNGTMVLLEAAKAYNKRFHHISTDEVFGSLDLGSSEKFRETTAYDPRSPYAASKAASDHLVRAYYHTHNLPITISNCSNNFGPYQFPEKLIPVAITNLLEGKKVPVYGDGLNVRDWLFVDDHCVGVDLVLQKGKIGSTYCFGGMTSDLPNIDLVRKICALLGVGDEMMEFVTDRKGHDRRYAVDWSLAHRDLGYEPAHDFDHYLRQTVEWYQNNRDWWQRCKTGEYQKYYEENYGKSK